MDTIQKFIDSATTAQMAIMKAAPPEPPAYAVVVDDLLSAFGIAMAQATADAEFRHRWPPPSDELRAAGCRR